jgi:GNAT superfamily N-acetyltransferase
MHRIKQTSIMEFFKVKKLLTKSRNDRLSFNFYSIFKGNFLNEILKGHVFLLFNVNTTIGIIIINYKSKEIFYLPIINSISIFKLLHILNTHFNTIDYRISLNYNKINIEEIKKYFPINIIENMMFMYKHYDISKSTIINDNNLKVRNLVVNKEEELRVKLQNKIFNNVKNRNELTVEEVLIEEKNTKFLKDYCYILEINELPTGYGQIVEIEDQYFLVNFGIIPEFRSLGYGYKFLNIISQLCAEKGIKNLYLSVNKLNTNAINLYKKDGFIEIYNALTISFH